MKKYNPFFYLLFIMLIMGAFASMAQNEYGLKIMGAAGALFGLVFLLEFISCLQREEKNFLFLIEAFIWSLIFSSVVMPSCLSETNVMESFTDS